MKKLSIEEMQQIAENWGGRCLSEVYVNTRTRLLWQCAEGHQWEATPGSVKKGTWCPYCATMRGTIEEMQQIAEARGGKCLSKTYVNSNTKLLWQCALRHQWEAAPDHVKRGTWCPYCSGRAKRTIEQMQQIAETRGGKCLSKTYVNNSTKLLWQCAKGHQWESIPHSIRSDHWCPDCADTRGTIEEMQQIAEDRGGKCLSKTYMNNRTKLLWQCAKGHQWETSPRHIKRGYWCPTCAKLK